MDYAENAHYSMQVVNWINSKLEHVDENFDADIFIGEFAALCIDLSFQMHLSEEQRIGQQEFVNDKTLVDKIVRDYDAIWHYGVTHIQERYGVSIFRYADMVFLKIMISNSPEMNDVFQEVIDQFLAEQEMDHPSRKIDPMDSGEMIKEFFQLFRELRVFYISRSMYKTEREREMYDRLSEIYVDLMTQHEL